jgi:hypothetical protein
MNNLSNSVRLTGFLGAAPEVKVSDNQKKSAWRHVVSAAVLTTNGSSKPTGTV